MKNNEGYIKLWRKIFNNPYYFSEPFTRIQAWVDLLLLANHKRGYIYSRGIKIELERGQVGHSIETLAKRWRWSRGKINRYFSALQKDNQIVIQKNNVTTCVSIINYELYQGSDRANDNPNVSPNGHQTDTNNKCNNVIIIYNTICGKKISLTEPRKKMINARIKEGHDIPQFKAVFECKYREWKDNPEMKKFIQIETILRASHFQKYLEQAREEYSTIRIPKQGFEGEELLKKMRYAGYD